MTDRPRYPRSACCAPGGCTRWSTLFPGEWLCARHWKMVPKRCRRALQKVWRSRRRRGRLEDQLWNHAKRYILLREAGL